MSYLQSKKKHNDILFNFTDTCKVKIDHEKVKLYRENISLGVKNYILFQKYSNFKWPLWLSASIDINSPHISISSPLYLINNSMRDGLSFTNFLSEEELFIDPSGMMSPSFDKWSIELWVATSDTVKRACENLDNVSQERDLQTSIIHTTWEDKQFKLNQVIYGARSSVDEAIIEIGCFLRERGKSPALIFLIRPYDNQELGGIESIKFIKDANCLSINGKKSIYVDNKPDFILSGSGENDIYLKDREISSESRCKGGMATLGLGYNLKKGGNNYYFRIALSGSKEISEGKCDYSKIMEDYNSFANIRINNRVNVKIPDKLQQKWFHASKISLLNFSVREIYNSDNDAIDFRTAYYIIHGYNRMGYYNESVRIIDFIVENFKISEKNISFNNVISACYILNSITEYFIHIRDIDYLQSKFDYIKMIAYILHKYSRKIKKIGGLNVNSIKYYYIKEEHAYDYILLTFSLNQYSYLARCMGIFGDEIKFAKEADRLSRLFFDNLFTPYLNGQENDFFYFNIFAGFPFRSNNITDDNIRAVLNKIEGYFKGLPLFVKSLGWDILSTIIISNNLILLKDDKGYEIFNKLLKMSDKRYILPDYMNPATGRANMGAGDSKIVSSMIFSTIRNILFIDNPERLDIFPAPRLEWFKPGRKIVIDNLPSRFGPICISVTSTPNEIQFRFEKLPKFVPPDIMINLPFETKIQPEDDFIVKKEDKKSFIINGWPSIVRFIRK